MEYRETPEFEAWFEQNIGSAVETSPDDLRLLAEASDAFDETRQLKRELLASRQEAAWEREKRMEVANLVACYEYDRWITIGVAAWALVATITAVCLWKGI